QYWREKNYGSDGNGYARDKGYPELLLGDPHERRMEELEDSDKGKPSLEVSHLTSLSLPSLIVAPANLEDKSGERPSVTARLAKRLGLRTNTNGTSTP
ncbi:hypothetical protein PQX77_009125, partial [Marasmius sp. AFHP31]